MGLEAETATWRAAVVMVRQGGEWFAPRPAVFLFDTPGGWSWVEPSYADQQGAAAFAMHERAGQPKRLSEDWFEWTGADGERVELTRYDAENDGSIAGAIDWWERYLVAAGRTAAEERELVRASLNEAAAPEAAPGQP